MKSKAAFYVLCDIGCTLPDRARGVGGSPGILARPGCRISSASTPAMESLSIGLVCDLLLGGSLPFGHLVSPSARARLVAVVLISFGHAAATKVHSAISSGGPQVDGSRPFGVGACSETLRKRRLRNPITAVCSFPESACSEYTDLRNTFGLKSAADGTVLIIRIIRTVPG